MLKTREDTSGSKAAASSETAAAVSRSLLFISHANPEDNAAASWFATQLTLLGYDVWCDLKNTSAGESAFWLKVQKKIEEEAAKFIFILSDTSRNFERKGGVYKEVQAASGVKRDNFIIPLRIEKLTGSVPILIGTDIYVNCENWANGLKELQERLIKDGVPRARSPDHERIKSWWPAVSAREALVRNEPDEIESNVFCFQSLPENIHLLSVKSEGNRLAGRDRLKGALPQFPAYYAHAEYAVSFAQAHDFLELTRGFDIEDAKVLKSETFLAEGCPEAGITADIARNITTYLIAASFEKFLGDKELSFKTLTYSRRRIWYLAHGLLPKNNFSYADEGKRKAPVWFGNTIKSFNKRYAWHFAVQPVIDVRIHMGILLSPKIIITRPYDTSAGERPVPIDEKRVAKKLSWWNDEWRKKIRAFSLWLADERDVIRVPSGYQDILIHASPKTEKINLTYVEKDDDSVIREVMSWADE